MDVRRTWTANQPAYWSALTGAPGPDGAAVSPFTVLDPAPDPLHEGRPDPDGTGDRVLRGYILAFAVDSDSCPVSWNHLSAKATIVNYQRSTAWSYNAWAFAEASNAAPGTSIGTCGELALDGVTYVAPYSLLMLDFFAPGSEAFGNQGMMGPGRIVSVDTDLTLHPVGGDLRQEGSGPITTKASFIIWNEDETQFTNLHRCITCWDQTLLSLYTEGGVQNHFLSLQTDKGKARIDGLASLLCTHNCCLDRGTSGGCADLDCQTAVCQVDLLCCTSAWDLDCAAQAVQICDVCDSLNTSAPLLGLAVKHLIFGAAVTFDTAGTSLVGMGTEATTIYYDGVAGGGVPPTLTSPEPDADEIGEILEWIDRTLIDSGRSRR